VSGVSVDDEVLCVFVCADQFWCYELGGNVMRVFCVSYPNVFYVLVDEY
jgi:hypothetical protein